MSTALFVVPHGIDDPARPSGGNSYDRRIADGLSARGWSLRPVELNGNWPTPGPDATSRLDDELAQRPHGCVVIIDGLVSSAIAPLLDSSAQRHRLVLLVHLPQGGPEERAVAAAASAVIVTSPWAGRWMERRYALPTERIHVIEPGVDPADVSRGSAAGDRLMCVAAISPIKGQDVLEQALALLRERRWRCDVVGSRAVDPAFAARVEHVAHVNGIDDRISFTGPLGGSALCDAYAHADLLVAPSRTETYGMVVTEALARGIPVVCSETGGLPETLGRVGVGERPGLLVPAGDAPALAAAIASWLDNPALRADLRARAQARRAGLTGWDRASDHAARVLQEVAA